MSHRFFQPKYIVVRRILLQAGSVCVEMVPASTGEMVCSWCGTNSSFVPDAEQTHAEGYRY